jgi:hypothetical protein
MFQERLLILRKAEEPVLLFDPLWLGLVDRTCAVDEILLRLERFTASQYQPSYEPS